MPSVARWYHCVTGESAARFCSTRTEREAGVSLDPVAHGGRGSLVDRRQVVDADPAVADGDHDPAAVAAEDAGHDVFEGQRRAEPGRWRGPRAA